MNFESQPPASATMTTTMPTGELCFEKRGKNQVPLPLPQEIVELSEAETACKFCGISYLLMSSMEKLQAEFTRLENELEERKDFAGCGPQLKALLEKIQKEKVISDDLVFELGLKLKAGDEQLAACSRERDDALARLQSREQEWRETEARGAHAQAEQEAQKKKIEAHLSELENQLTLKSIQMHEFKTQILSEFSIKKTLASKKSLKMRQNLCACLRNVGKVRGALKKLDFDIRSNFTRYVNEIKSDFEDRVKEVGRFLQLIKQNHDIEQRNRETKYKTMLENERQSTLVLQTRSTDLALQLECQRKACDLLTKDNEKLQLALAEMTPKVSDSSQLIHELAMFRKRATEAERKASALLADHTELSNAHINQLRQLQEAADERAKKKLDSELFVMQTETKGKIDELEKKLTLSQETARISQQEFLDLASQLKTRDKQLQTAHVAIAIAEGQRNESQEICRLYIEKLAFESCAKAKAENKGRGLKEELLDVQAKAAALQEHAALTDAKIKAEVQRLHGKTEQQHDTIAEMNLEIIALKETVRRECEERVRLLTMLDGVQEGPLASANDASTVPSGSQSASNEAKCSQPLPGTEHRPSTTSVHKPAEDLVFEKRYEASLQVASSFKQKRSRRPL